MINKFGGLQTRVLSRQYSSTYKEVLENRFVHFLYALRIRRCFPLSLCQCQTKFAGRREKQPIYELLPPVFSVFHPEIVQQSLVVILCRETGVHQVALDVLLSASFLHYSTAKALFLAESARNGGFILVYRNEILHCLLQVKTKHPHIRAKGVFVFAHKTSLLQKTLILTM